MNSKFALIALLCAAFTLNNCSKDDGDDPVNKTFNISQLEPESGSEGTMVAIAGTGFSINPEENIVKFNGIEAEVSVASENALLVTVPIGATTGNVTVTKDGKIAEGPKFTVSTPSVTDAFYIQFKAAGTLKIFQTSNPGYQSCGQCACANLPALGDRVASVSVCNDDNDWVTAADIQGWKGDKILFTTSSFPFASIGYEEGGTYYSSENVENQTGSEVNITAVVADGEFGGNKQFKVTGNFKCKVASSAGDAITITEGTFVTRFSED